MYSKPITGINESPMAMGYHEQKQFIQFIQNVLQYVRREHEDPIKYDIKTLSGWLLYRLDEIEGKRVLRPEEVRWRGFIKNKHALGKFVAKFQKALISEKIGIQGNRAIYLFKPIDDLTEEDEAFLEGEYSIVQFD